MAKTVHSRMSNESALFVVALHSTSEDNNLSASSHQDDSINDVCNISAISLIQNAMNDFYEGLKASYMYSETGAPISILEIIHCTSCSGLSISLLDALTFVQLQESRVDLGEKDRGFYHYDHQKYMEVDLQTSPLRLKNSNFTKAVKTTNDLNVAESITNQQQLLNNFHKW